LALQVQLVVLVSAVYLFAVLLTARPTTFLQRGANRNVKASANSFSGVRIMVTIRWQTSCSMRSDRLQEKSDCRSDEQRRLVADWKFYTVSKHIDWCSQLWL